MTKQANASPCTILFWLRRTLYTRIDTTKCYGVYTQPLSSSCLFMVTTTSAWWLLMPWCYCAFMSSVISDNHDDVGTIITIDILFPRNVHIYAFNNTYKQLKSSMCIQRYMYHLVTARETTASLSKLAAFRLNSTWLGHELYITKCKIKRQ